MPDGPLVSVVIPSFNRSARLERAIDSVLAQTYRRLEVLVVDDGSTDDSWDLVTRLSAKEPRIHVLRHHANRGAQAARNTGITAAKGDWVAFLDSDDRYLPDSIERRLETALRTGTSLVHSECLVERADGVMEPFGIPPMTGDIRAAVLSTPGPVFQALLVRARCLSAIGGLDESIVAYQEWDTAIRLSFVSRFSFVSAPTFVYNTTSADGLSRNRDLSATGYEQVLLKHARQILRMGGPALVAKHLRETARQRRIAGQPLGSAVRLALGVMAWPFEIRAILRSARTLIVADRGLGEQ
jgi:glycosyltransferase involved in cell wall biosynthesis